MQKKYVSINGIDVNLIMSLPDCKVKAMGKIWRAKSLDNYSETKKCIFLMDDQGNLTGEYSIIPKAAKSSTPAPSSPSTASETKPDEGWKGRLKSLLSGQKPVSETSQLNSGVLESYDQEETNSVTRAIKQFQRSRQIKTAMKAAGPKKLQFHVGAFVLGASLVLFAAFTYIMFQFAIYEGLL